MHSRWGGDRKNTPSQFAGRLREAVLEANARIFREAIETPERRGMGTTVTAAGVLQSFIYIAQVGDSRAYLVRDGDAAQLTRDQSVTQKLVESGSLTEEEAELSEHRNVILQALGTKPEVEVELTYQELRRGDRLVVCSDGLSGLVQAEEVAGRIDGEEDLVQACEDLVAMANARGGPDNITVVALAFDGPGLDEPDESELPGRHVYEVTES
jgi:protein phosphatase